MERHYFDMSDVLTDVFDLQRRTVDLETKVATLHDLHDGLESDNAELTRRVMELESQLAPDYKAGERAKSEVLRKLDIQEPHSIPVSSKKRHA